MYSLRLVVKDVVGTSIIRHRKTASIIMRVIGEEPVVSLTLDFLGVDFASRGFFQELLDGLKDHVVTCVNVNDSLRTMMDVAFSKPVLCLGDSEIRDLSREE